MLGDAAGLTRALMAGRLGPDRDLPLGGENSFVNAVTFMNVLNILNVAPSLLFRN